MKSNIVWIVVLSLFVVLTFIFARSWVTLSFADLFTVNIPLKGAIALYTGIGIGIGVLVK